MLWNMHLGLWKLDYDMRTVSVASHTLSRLLCLLLG